MHGYIYFQFYHTYHISFTALSRNKLKEAASGRNRSVLPPLFGEPLPAPPALGQLSSYSVWTPAFPEASLSGALRPLFPFPEIFLWLCGRPFLSQKTFTVPRGQAPVPQLPSSHQGHSPSSRTHFSCNFNRKCFITFIYWGGVLCHGVCGSQRPT